MAKIETYAPPSRLYRYRPLSADKIEQELAAIREGYIFYPNFGEMNDPMEGVHTESSILRKTNSYKETLEAVASAKAKLGIASLSESYESEPMWAHYAGGFKGMCVAYSVKQLLACLDDDHALVRMTYNEKPPVLLKGRTSPSDMARLALSTKAVRWMPEREWRLIRSKRGPASYGTAKCITAIYLGSRIEPGHRAAIERTARQLKIAVRAMEIDKYAISWGPGVRKRPSKAPLGSNLLRNRP